MQQHHHSDYIDDVGDDNKKTDAVRLESNNAPASPFNSTGEVEQEDPFLTTRAILYRQHPEESELFEEEVDDDDDDDPYDDVECLPPGRHKVVFLVSDATGVTARSMLLKSLVQFDLFCAEDAAGTGIGGGGCCPVQTRTFTFIRSKAALSQILAAAREKNACVMYTLADPGLREYAAAYCTNEVNNDGSGGVIQNIDLMGPSLDILGSFLGQAPMGTSTEDAAAQQIPRIRKRRRKMMLGDSYYRRVDAVEFCLKADDGQAPWLLPEADIVLVGVSRSGKTPLSVLLSQTMALKVANIPLVVQVQPPSQLLDRNTVDPRRVFCLTISPNELGKIRRRRIERTVQGSTSVGEGEANSNVNMNNNKYADRAYLLRDLIHARQLSHRHNWTEVDVTGRAIEETATVIVELYNERFLSR